MITDSPFSFRTVEVEDLKERVLYFLDPLARQVFISLDPTTPEGSEYYHDHPGVFRKQTMADHLGTDHRQITAAIEKIKVACLAVGFVPAELPQE